MQNEKKSGRITGESGIELDKRVESMPKNVQKLIRRLANIQRKEIVLLRSGNESGEEPKDFEQKMSDLFFKGSKAIEELFDIII